MAQNWIVLWGDNYDTPDVEFVDSEQEALTRADQHIADGNPQVRVGQVLWTTKTETRLVKVRD